MGPVRGKDWAKCVHQQPFVVVGYLLTNGAAAPRLWSARRGRWFPLQPYLIALLMSKGIPMLRMRQALAD